jgi:hypothetical protein
MTERSLSLTRARAQRRAAMSGPPQVYGIFPATARVMASPPYSSACWPPSPNSSGREPPNGFLKVKRRRGAREYIKAGVARSATPSHRVSRVTKAPRAWCRYLRSRKPSR